MRFGIRCEWASLRPDKGQQRGRTFIVQKPLWLAKTRLDQFDFPPQRWFGVIATTALSRHVTAPLANLCADAIP